MDKDIKQKIVDYAVRYKLDTFYINRYIKIVETFQGKTWNCKTQNHHIFPVSWSKRIKESPIDEPKNLITISIKGHIVLHHILMKTCDIKMIPALQKLIGGYKKEFFESFHYVPAVKLSALAIEAETKRHCKPIVDLKTGEIFDSLNDLNEKRNLCVTPPSIRNRWLVNGTYYQYKSIADKNGIEYELQQCLKERENINNRKRERQQLAISTLKKSIVKLIDGTEYESASEAARQYGIHVASFASAIKSGRKRLGSYWGYKDWVDSVGGWQKANQIMIERTNQVEADRVKRISKPVVNLDTKQTFESAAKAGNGVARAISKNRRYKGCFYEYIENMPDLTDDSIQKRIKQCEQTVQTKKINAIKKRTKFIQCIETQQIMTLQEASKLFNMSSTNFGRAALNNKTAAGYHWKYIESETE